MAFALALKSNYDFPNKGKKFLTLTLSLALFTLLISNMFLHYLLKKLGFNERMITEIKSDDNIYYDENDENKFVKIKKYLLYLHDRYLLPLISKESQMNENNNNFDENNNKINNPDSIIPHKINKIETDLELTKEDKNKSYDS